MSDQKLLDLVDRLAGIDTTIMSDVLDEFGLPNQVLSSILRPLHVDSKLAGIAFCVRREPTVNAKSPYKSASKFELESRMRPGLVAVVDAGGNADAGAMVGGFGAATLKAKGCRGLVVYGAIRDGREIMAMNLPAFCIAPSPMSGTRRLEVIQVDVPLAFPGTTHGHVIIHPYDLILGDYDGVVVLPSQHSEKLIAAAEKVTEIERQIQSEIARGTSREQAMKKYPRFDHIGAVSK